MNTPARSHPSDDGGLARLFFRAALVIPLVLLALAGVINYFEYAGSWSAWAGAMRDDLLVCAAAAVLLGLFGRNVRQFVQADLDSARETLRRATERSTREQVMEEVNRSKDDFLGALNHELRSPLSAIAASVEVLRRIGIADARGQQALLVMGRQLDNMKRLLGTLLDVSRAIHGELRVDARPVNLLALARNLAATQPRLFRGGLRLEVDGAEVWAQADPGRVEQMLNNLLDNAEKYGGRHIRVLVSEEPGCAVLTVADDGEGIRRDLLPRLFEAFPAASDVSSGARGGLGLGLTLVQRLATLQGGSVHAASEGRGKGSTFSIRLPLATEHAPAQPAAPAVGAAPKRRILIVEDQTDARESLQTVLEMEGHKVAVAADGMEGLAKFRLFEPEIVLVDIGLPGMDGYEWGRKIRSRYGATGARLVALTGYGQEEDRQKAREAGFDGHLTKPVSYAELQFALQ
jgi:signal transduction histidine kinase